jgi:hypothetical protein
MIETKARSLDQMSEDIANRVDECPPVARRSAGKFGTVATYLPGRRIDGVRFDEHGTLEVHVELHWGCDFETVRREVFSAIRSAWPTGTTQLFIENIDLPPDSTTGYAPIFQFPERIEK